MPQNTQKFVSFLADHFRPLEAMGRENTRFSSDDEIFAFLRRFDDSDKNFARLIGLMKEVEVLVELAGAWSLPHFLAEFLERLAERHALATPNVIRGWIEVLEKHVNKLVALIENSKHNVGSFDSETGQFLLRDIADVFKKIVRTVHDNCERISIEVAQYRLLTDVGYIRRRLLRLIELHDEYLEPIIGIVNVRGEFHNVTEQISNCCAHILHLCEDTSSFGEEVRYIQKDVVWLRQVILVRADEARRELAPLCEAAVRESKIAKGVNRALQAIREGQWHVLNLDQNLVAVEDKDGSFIHDRAFGHYLRLALDTTETPPPRISIAAPASLPIPITIEDILERLDLVEPLSDILSWILEMYNDISLDGAVQLFHDVLIRRPETSQNTAERLNYERGNLIVNATRWTWKGGEDDNGQSTPYAGRPLRNTQGSVQVT